MKRVRLRLWAEGYAEWKKLNRQYSIGLWKSFLWMKYYRQNSCKHCVKKIITAVFQNPEYILPPLFECWNQLPKSLKVFGQNKPAKLNEFIDTTDSDCLFCGETHVLCGALLAARLQNAKGKSEIFLHLLSRSPLPFSWCALSFSFKTLLRWMGGCKVN